MSNIQSPKYDNDYITFGYLKKSLNSEDEKQSKKLEVIPKNYNSPPVPPYYAGSLLLLNGKIYRCIKSRQIGSFCMSDWQIIVSTEEIDTALKFMYDVNKLEYSDQTDGVIETFYQSDDPSINWITNLDKEKHVSDLWTVDLEKHYQYEKKATNPVTYGWKKVNVPTTLFDIFDGYKKIFVTTPTNYQKDDLWLGEITKVATEDSETFDESHWENRDDFIESSRVEQEEYHKIYLLPKITEINRQSSAEIKKAIDAITLTVSQTYETKTQVEKYIDDVKTEVAEEYTTKEEMNAQFSITSNQINSIVEKNTSQDDQIGYLNQEYSTIKQRSDEISATVANQNNKISEVTQTVNELNSKISDIADITTSVEDNDAQVELNNINQSEPIKIVIRPILENISYLYPNTNLFPSENLFLKVRTIRFNNITTNEVFDYELPDDLLYYDVDTYDEFILDYDEHSCVVNKKVGYNADGTTYALETPTTNSYDYPLIELTNGDYVVSVLGYQNAYIFARLMAQNIYTTQFATRAEVKSQVSQKANEIISTVEASYETKENAVQQYTKIQQTTNSITSEVSNKVGKNEVISRINQTAETVVIEASKVNLQGIVNFINAGKTTTINGNRITTGTITATQVASDIITTTNFSAQNINADRITSGTISTQRLASDVITTTSFQSQSINANNITSGTIATARLSADVITTANFSAQSINASNINSGTLSADRINGGTISASTIKLKNVTLGTSSSKIGGWTIGTSSIYTNSSKVASAMYTNGNVIFGGNYGMIKFDTDPVRITTNNKMLFCDSYSEKNMASSLDTISIRAFNGQIHINSNFAVYSGSNRIDGSSSKAIKTNIKPIEKQYIDDIYLTVKSMPLYTYDYLEKYGDKDDFGFIIEDIENTCLKRVLKINQNINNPLVKNYGTLELSKMNLVLIKELMKKIEFLEEKICH